MCFIVDFSHSAGATDDLRRVGDFVRTEIEPVEADYHRTLRAAISPEFVPPVVEKLKTKARAQGLWNLFLPETEHGGAGLSNVEYAPLAEQMGRSPLAPEVFNCNAPDTGNAEVLVKYGSAEQQERWLVPLLRGEIRSAFCMTEPGVAPPHGTNMADTPGLDGDEIVLNGRKWWSSGIGHPNCGFVIFMGLTDADAPRHARATMLLVAGGS